jgi:hypothetical protein
MPPVLGKDASAVGEKSQMSPMVSEPGFAYANETHGVRMTEPSLKSIQGERNRLWAEARLKGLAKDTPVRERIAELDAQIRERKAKASA